MADLYEGLTLVERQAHRVLVMHQRTGIGPCSCGRMKPGEDYFVHLMWVLREAGMSIQAQRGGGIPHRDHSPDRCCYEHGHHVMPHRGCILR